MLDYCPFLEPYPGKGREAENCCAAGINFYFVGAGRELCRTCPVPGWGTALQCLDLEVWAFLESAGPGRLSVRAEAICFRPEGPSPEAALCQSCPAARSESEMGFQTAAWQGAKT